MDSVSSAAAYVWHTSVLRVPIGLAVMCIVAYNRAHMIRDCITSMRHTFGNERTDRIICASAIVSIILVEGIIIKTLVEACT
jgi:hypothetical protein